jgi:anti-anti-sigma factor
METLKVDVEDIRPGIARVSLHGVVDPARVGILKDAIEGLFARGVVKLVMDLKGAKYIASSGIACFITSLDQASSHGGKIVFIAADHQVQRIAQILMLSDVFSFVDDEAAALKLLGKPKS